MYEKYINFVKSITEDESLEIFKTFKQNPNYRDILEHVSFYQGVEYLKYIEYFSNIKKEEILEFSNLNDSLGSPEKFDYGIGNISPSNLRYIFHSHIILSYIKKLKLENLNIIELGGGYGGLCLALKHFCKKYNIEIKTYKIVDLDEIIKLQEIYHKKLNINDVEYFKASNFGKDIKGEDYFLISNYCFSEISDSLQKKYIKNLFGKVSNGFMAWNFIPVYNFGFDCHIEDEYPLTGGNNKYVYF
jgi:hypothetical protein